MKQPEIEAGNGIAVIGMAGCFPGARGIEQLWQNLCSGTTSVHFFENEDLDPSIGPDLFDHPNYVKARGIIADPDKFDAAFFNISPRQAEILDPQNRIFLQLAWGALEDAGYVSTGYDGMIGVFAGKSESTYRANHIHAHPGTADKYDTFQLALANEKDYLATSVSYHLDLKGPSVTVQTACSTSLVAVCQAFDSLMNFQCDMALAGGVSIVCPQESGYLWSEGSILSKDGRCRSFDAKAQGAVFGNGAGIVVLKRIEDAVKDRDHIYAVIRGAAINNDGAAGKMSFMAPSVQGQAHVIAMAQAGAEVHPESISYIEAHGTATALGDPIEVAALTQAFRLKTQKKRFCAIGSIKSNIGHLDTAAGIAGFIKTALMLKHKKLPPSLHFENPNPNIHFEDTPFYVIDEFTEWATGPTPRLAGVSSFGVGGTNAHVVLEEGPVLAASDPSAKWRLLTLSAKTQSALDAATRNLATHIRQQDELNMADVAYTLHLGREAFRFRRAVVCKNRADALDALETMDPERVLTAVPERFEQQIVMGPGNTLCDLARSHLKDPHAALVIQSLPDSSQKDSESACFLNSLGRLWLAGRDVQWDRLYRGERRMRVPLPTYPFEGKRYWIETVPLAATPEALTSPAAPADKVEQAIAEIWGKLLGIEKIECDDNYFELGGDSLSASQVVSRIRETFHVEIPLDVFFEDASVSALAHFVRKARHEKMQAKAADPGFSADADYMPIQPVPRERGLSVSFSQERMWFLTRLEPENVAYNLSGGFRFKGRIRVDVLRRCLTEIVRRHEVMRTIFRETDGKPVQVVLPPFAFPLPVVDLREFSASAREQRAQRLSGEEARRPFDLSTGPFFRGVLLCLEEDDHILVLTMHHIITDGWSFDVFVGELEALYKAFSEGRPSPLTELSIQYADFAAWQRSRLQGEILESQMAYWKTRLGGALPALQLPIDRPRPAVQGYRGANRFFDLPASLTEALRELGQRQGATLFMTLLAAFKGMLYRYTGQADFAVGSPIANRTRTELEGLIGFFVNMLVLRTDLSGDPRFVELLGRVRETTMGAFTHQDMPFEKIVEALNPARDMSYPPLFQVMFAYQNALRATVELSGLTLTPVEIDAGSSMFDLTFYMWEVGKGLSGRIEYNTDLFDAGTIERLIGHFKTLLAGVAVNVEHRLSELPMLTGFERHQLLTEWNATGEAYPGDKRLAQLFEEQAGRTPEAEAIVCKGETLTYDGLNGRVNQLAMYLRALGVGPDTFVGIYMERSVDMVVGLLGVLKAGGAYVPLDPSFPLDRVQFMLEDSGVRILLTQSVLSGDFPGYKGEIVCIDSDWQRMATGSPDNPPGVGVPENLAYLIYTSGSTGKPKGVQISNRALINFLGSMRREPGLSSDDTVLSVTTVSFDIFGLELFLPLITGARVVLAERDDTVDGARLAALLRESGATVMQATPATWRLLLQAGWQGDPSLKILCGGEALPHDLIVLLLDRCKEFWNLYGPTETTIWSTVYRIRSKADPVLIGSPIANTQVYILDGFLQPVPIGVAGELHIGGYGLARGYLNRPELTAEKFIANPFSNDPESRIYKTGDLARYRPDGTIECLGRTDFQVKVRGFRVEPGEIETLLNRHPLIRQSAVVVRPDPVGGNQLVAYIISKNDPESGVSELRPELRPDLRPYLRAALPEYMVPSRFSFLESMPLTSNGKINRNALPAITDQRKGDLPGVFVAASDAIEMQLTQIWESVLGMRPIGIKDDYFEIGGHSLLAARLFSRIDKLMGLNLPLATLFHAPTIELLAKVIRNKDWRAGWSSLVPIQPGGAKPPLFFVHGAGGNVLLYRELSAYLGPDQPFYGLQSQGLDGKKPQTRFEEMAALYIREMRSLQPDGPYHIGGYCLGGAIALEMAQQLNGQGQEVALLAMIESYNFRSRMNSLPVYYGLIHRLQNLKFHWDNLRLLDTKDQMAFLSKKSSVSLKRMNQRMNIVFSGIFQNLRQPRGEKCPHMNLTRINDQAAFEYIPESYQGKITLFRPRTHFAGYNEPDFGWGKIARGGVEVHTFAVNPRGILVEPFVKELARELKHCIEIRDCNYARPNCKY